MTIRATDECGNVAEAVVPVQIDTSKPVVSCTFGGKKIASTLTSVLARQMFDADFDYSASDSCGEPLDVTVKVFSSEREGQFSRRTTDSHNSAILHNDTLLPNRKTKMILQHHICPKPTNAQCVKDPKVQDARLYTAKVTATDASGLTSEAECSLTILPVGDLTFLDVDTSKSTQRHFLAQYSSVFQS